MVGDFSNNCFSGRFSFSNNIEKLNLEFSSNQSIDKISLYIKGNGARAYVSTQRFCKSQFKCSFPMKIGGNVSFFLYHKGELIHNVTFLLPNLSFHCTGDIWHERICEFKDMCFHKNEFKIISHQPRQQCWHRKLPKTTK